MNQSKREIILTIFEANPVISTNHIARYFGDRGSPLKRASEALTELEGEKLIEGRRGAIGSPKVWRLSKKGRELRGVTRAPIPLNSNKVNHYLAIASAWQDLRRMGDLINWTVELREEFKYAGKKQVYCPDAFFILRTPKGARAFVLECQLSPLSTNKWSEKWTMHSNFLDSEAFPKASFQTIPGRVIKPAILVLSSQQQTTVQGGSNLPLIIASDIKNAPLF